MVDMRGPMRCSPCRMLIGPRIDRDYLLRWAAEATGNSKRRQHAYMHAATMPMREYDPSPTIVAASNGPVASPSANIPPDHAATVPDGSSLAASALTYGAP
jgi:hypothetical protein